MLLSTFATSFDRLQVIHQLIENGYAVLDNLLSDSENLIQLCAEAQASTTTPIFAKTNQPEDIRTDLTYDVDPLDNEKNPYISKLSRTLQFDIGGAVDMFLPQPLYCRERPQFAYYKGEGSFYTRHYDNPRMLKGGVDNLRRLTVLFYLNEKWDENEDGGELRLHVRNEKDYDVTIAPKLNRCVLFFSDLIEHEVLPSFGHRLAVTVWLSELLPDPASGLSKTIHPNDQLLRDFFVQCSEKVANGTNISKEVTDGNNGK